MLDDPHLTVVMYNPIGEQIFPRTDIKGGVAITLRDLHQNFGSIGVYTPYDELKSVMKKKSTILKVAT